jgi:hypothetical protein
VFLCKKYVTFDLGPHSVSHRRRSSIVNLAIYLFDGPLTIRIIMTALIGLFKSYLIFPQKIFPAGDHHDNH